MTVVDRMKRQLVQRHSLLARAMPRGYRAYPSAGGRIFLDLRESPTMLARVLRVYEPAKTQVVREWLKPGMTFVDVGANKGDFSLLAARAMGDNGVVIAVEPAPGNCTWLERSVKANGYKCIEVLPNALSDEEGEAELFLAELSGWHSLVRSPRKQLTGSVTVKTRTLDDVIAERVLPPIEMLKVDVEGGEVAVLAGAAETLAAPGRRLVLLDLHPPMVDPAAICDGLRDAGYEICRIHPSLPPLGHVDYHTTEVAAIKRDG